jgi:predicted  nucleic acid-binding Zn-ribbon protein
MSALNMKIDSLRVEADRLNSSLATQERHIQVLQSEYARKAATAAARRVEISNHIRRLEEEIVEAKAKIESLWLAAKALDAGFTDRRLADLDYLTKELHPPPNPA